LPARWFRDSAAAHVTDLQREIHIAMNSYFGSRTPRMTMNIGEALLHHPE
jgi:hypothetical protein